jgi:hypothetical protein
METNCCPFMVTMQTIRKIHSECCHDGTHKRIYYCKATVFTLCFITTYVKVNILEVTVETNCGPCIVTMETIEEMYTKPVHGTNKDNVLLHSNCVHLWFITTGCQSHYVGGLC